VDFHLSTLEAARCQESPDGRPPCESSRPFLDVIRKQIEAARSSSLPASALAKAWNYTLTARVNEFETSVHGI
jgi:hypothetical protein